MRGRHLVTAALIAGAAVTGAVVGAAPASALPPGCEEIPWGIFQNQQRAICDGPIREDGSWLRTRVIGYPAGVVNASSTCYGMYYGYGFEQSSCTMTPARWVAARILENTSYVVFPYNVLPNEPGHLG